MADLDNKQGSTDKTVESIIQYLVTRLDDAKAGEEDLPRKEMQKSVDDLNEIKEFLLHEPQHSASALLRTVLKGMLEDLGEKAKDQGAGSNDKEKLARLVKNVPKLKTQLEVDPQKVKQSTVLDLHNSIIPAVLDRLELLEDYKHPNQESRVSDQVQKLTNDLQKIRSSIEQLQEKGRRYFENASEIASEIASELIQKSYIDDLDAGKLNVKLDKLKKSVVQLMQQIPNMTWESIIEGLRKRLYETKAKCREDMPQKEKDVSEIKDFLLKLNESKDSLLEHPENSACALVRTVLKGIQQDLDQKADDQGAGIAAKLDRLEKDVTKLKKQLKVDPQKVKQSTVLDLHISIIPAVLDRLELLANYKHPKQERNVTDQVRKLTNDLQKIGSLIEQLQNGGLRYFKDAGYIASELIKNSYIDDLDAVKLNEKLDKLEKSVVQLMQQIPNMTLESIIGDIRTRLDETKASKDTDQKEKDASEIKDFLLNLNKIKDSLLDHPGNSACTLVRTVLKGIQQDLDEQADDPDEKPDEQRRRIAAKLDRLEKDVPKLKKELEVDPEEVRNSKIRDLHKFIIPTVVDRLDLAENYRKKEPSSDKVKKPSSDKVKKPSSDKVKKPSSDRVSDQVHKLTNDLQYIGILIKQLQDNKDNLDKEVQDFQGKAGEIANALVQHSYIDDLEAKKLQEKLDILTKLVVKLKQQISSRNQFSGTGPDSNPYTQVGVEIASTQANKILPVLHRYSSLPKKQAFLDFREVYEGLEPREKMCLLYFALIPENEIVKKSFMTYWWVGEGLIPEGIDKGTYEDIGQEILKKLVERGCIEPENKEHRPAATNYKMNPFIRSAVIKLAEEAKFCDFGGKSNLTAISPFKNLVCLVDGNSKEILDGGSKWPLDKLQTIFNVNEPYPDVFKLEWFPGMKNLKVLYLGRWQISPKHHIEVESTDFLQGLKNMKLLRFLSLQGMSRITELPPSVGKLLNLRILDLRACHNLEKLPGEIGRLRRLTHLDLSECYLLERMPKGIASLKRLQVLKGFVVKSVPSGKDKSNPKPSRKYCSLQDLPALKKLRKYCSLRDLSALKKLRKLSIYTNSYNFPYETDMETFHKFEMLQKLTITWGAGEIPKNGGNGHQQGKGEENPTPETKISPENSRENQKQDGSPTKPTAATASSPKDGGDMQKQHEGEIQPNESANTCPKNDGDGREQDKSPAQPKNSGDSQKQDNVKVPPPVATITSPKSGGNNQEKDKGAAKQSEVATTSTQSGEDRFRKLEAPPPVAITSPKSGGKNQEKDQGAAQQSELLKLKLLKLELKCYPQRTAPNWLHPEQLPKLKKLYIRGGELHNLNPVKGDKKWKVKTLRLKFLNDLKLDWKTLESSFPELDYLEAFECPKLTFLPFNENGVLKQQSKE